MITRLEAIRYRCFERLEIELGNFRVIVGANGSGKTTLLDMPMLFGALLRTTNVSKPFMERQGGRPPRAGSLNELVFAGRGSDFSLALEARLPAEIQARVIEGTLSRMRSDNTRRAFRNDQKRWPSHIRYEITLRIFNDRELQVLNEYLFLFPEASGPDRKLGGLFGASAKTNRHWRPVLEREFGYEVEFQPEVPSGRSPRAMVTKVAMPDIQLALPRVMYEPEAEYPAATWLFRLLSGSAVFLDPDWSAMRLASPPGQAKEITADGRNFPWLALDLKRDGAPEGAGAEYRSERYMDWIAHVKTALPQIADIDVREREDDHHAYFRVHFRGGFNVPQSALSDGTLRILTLTLAPYLSTRPAILVTEEPENGIHPRAIEAVLQSLSSLPDSQVWVSSHSPVVLGSVDINHLLCARLSSEGGVQIVAGRDHPRLIEWRRGIDLDLGALFAAEVLN